MIKHPYFIGQHCDKVVGPEDALEFCTETAAFIYYGLVPEVVLPPDSTKAEIKRMYAKGHPCSMLLCPDHARALAHDFHGLIIDHKVRIERLDVNRLRFRCRNCLVSITMTWDNTELSTNPGSLVHCPRCGVAGVPAWPDPEQDYVDWVCEQFNGMPRQLVLMLYAEWPRNDRRYPTFRHYVQAQISEFDDTGTFEAAEA